MAKGLVARAQRLERLMRLRLEICQIQNDAAGSGGNDKDDRIVFDMADRMLGEIHTAVFLLQTGNATHKHRFDEDGHCRCGYTL